MFSVVLYAPIDKRCKSSAFHAGVTGSNPVRSTNGSVVQSGEYVPVTHEVARSKLARVARLTIKTNLWFVI